MRTNIVGLLAKNFQGSNIGIVITCSTPRWAPAFLSTRRATSITTSTFTHQVAQVGRKSTPINIGSCRTKLHQHFRTQLKYNTISQRHFSIINVHIQLPDEGSTSSGLSHPVRLRRHLRPTNLSWWRATSPFWMDDNCGIVVGIWSSCYADGGILEWVTFSGGGGSS